MKKNKQCPTMEDHSSLRYSDGEDDKTDREVSSILLQLSHPVVFPDDSSPRSLKWGRTKKRSYPDFMPPPNISSGPVIKPQSMTEVVGSNSSSSCLAGEAKKTKPQCSREGLEEECSMTYLKLKQKTSSQPSPSCPVLEIQADTGLSGEQAVAPPAQPIAEKRRRITNGQNLRPLRPLMIGVDRTDNARHSEAAALLLEARLNMDRGGFNQEPRNSNMERRNFDLEPRRNNINMERRGFNLEPMNKNMELRGFNLDPKNNNMERRNFDLQPRNNNMEWLRFDLEPRNNNMERRGFNINLDPKINNNMERRGFNLEARHNMERRGFGLEPRNNKMEWLRFDLEASHNMERRGFDDLQASRNKKMEWLRGFDDLMASRNKNMELRGVDLEARNNNVERRGFDLNLPATEEVNHRDTVESQRAAAIKEHQQDAAEARQRRLGLRRAKKTLQNSKSISPNK